jgi:nitrile hydratase subunit beta
VREENAVTKGVHELAGIHWEGPVCPDRDKEAPFLAEWEKGVFAITACSVGQGFYNFADFRQEIERMHPVAYLSARYYERWLHTAIINLSKQGVIDPAELEERTKYYLENPDAEVPLPSNPELMDKLAAVAVAGVPYRKDDPDKPPKYKVGDRVRVRQDYYVDGHTRMASYVRGKVGEIAKVFCNMELPDSGVTGGKPQHEYVYAVRFDPKEMWGETAESGVAAHYWDAYECYLEPA